MHQLTDIQETISK